MGIDLFISQKRFELDAILLRGSTCIEAAVLLWVAKRAELSQLAKHLEIEL